MTLSALGTEAHFGQWSIFPSTPLKRARGARDELSGLERLKPRTRLRVDFLSYRGLRKRLTHYRECCDGPGFGDFGAVKIALSWDLEISISRQFFLYCVNIDLDIADLVYFVLKFENWSFKTWLISLGARIFWMISNRFGGSGLGNSIVLSATPYRNMRKSAGQKTRGIGL